MNEQWQGLNEDPADYVRRRGWEVGTVIEGDEGHGAMRIRITAVGQKSVLAMHDRTGRENSWTFAHRDWRVVGEEATA